MRHGYFYLNQKWHYLNIIHCYLLAGLQRLPLYSGCHSSKMMSSLVHQIRFWSHRPASSVGTREAACGRCTCSPGTTSTTSSPRQAFKRVQSKAAESIRNGRKTRSVRFKRLSRDGGHCHHFLRQWPAERLRVFFSKCDSSPRTDFAASPLLY